MSGPWSHKDELRCAVIFLRARGLDFAQIAHRLRIKPSHVLRLACSAAKNQRAEHDLHDLRLLANSPGMAPLLAELLRDLAE